MIQLKPDPDLFDPGSLMADYQAEMFESIDSNLKRWWVRIVLWGFDLLYHSFAWIYDFAAWLVSAGKWNDWICSAGQLVQPPGPFLDLGCGKGILLQQAVQRGIPTVGLDESPQMLRYSRRRLPANSCRLIRGIGQALPIKTSTFQTVTATFPAAYIFETTTLSEIHRVLKPDGRLIMLLTAEVAGSSLHERLIRCIASLFGFGHVSGTLQDSLQKLFRAGGFAVRLEWVSAAAARLLVIIAQPV